MHSLWSKTIPTKVVFMPCICSKTRNWEVKTFNCYNRMSVGSVASVAIENQIWQPLFIAGKTEKNSLKNGKGCNEIVEKSIEFSAFMRITEKRKESWKMKRHSQRWLVPWKPSRKHKVCEIKTWHQKAYTLLDTLQNVCSLGSLLSLSEYIKII